MYFQSTRPMMYQDLIKEMKAYEKGFGENHFTEDSLSFIRKKKKEERCLHL